MVIALIMIVLTGAGAYASAPWTFNPSDYRYDMSLYLNVVADGQILDYSTYEVAAFCDGECRGIAVVLSLPDGGQCLYLRARSNAESGETLTLRFYNNMTGEEHSVNNYSLPFESNSRLGYPSDPVVVDLSGYSTGMAGDVNYDGILDMTDVNILKDHIMAEDTDSLDKAIIDLNNDGVIDMTDVNYLKDIILKD